MEQQQSEKIAALEKKIINLQRQFTEEKNQLEREFLSQKEQWFLSRKELEMQNEDLNNQILKLRIANNHALVINDFTGNGPKSVAETYVKVKSDLEVFVSEFDIPEEDELQLEITLSTSVFKELLPMIRNYVNGELEDDKIGQIIKSDERIRKQLIENTQQGLTAQIQLELRRSVLEEKILIKLQELSERVVTFLTDMMVCDKHLELVWCDRNDEYNPREHTSINLIDKVIVDKALYPCLMMPSSRSVFEKAKVITKENREKKNKH